MWQLLSELEQKHVITDPGGESMDKVYDTDEIDRLIRNAWDNEPPHYRGRFPKEEQKAHKFSREVCTEVLNLDVPIFVRVNRARQARARYTWQPPRAYVTIPVRYFRGYRDLDNGVPGWVTVLLHEFTHIECYRHYRAGGHGKTFQIIERHLFHAYGMDPEYTRVPGYWRRLYDLNTGELLFDRTERGLAE